MSSPQWEGIWPHCWGDNIGSIYPICSEQKKTKEQKSPLATLLGWGVKLSLQLFGWEREKNPFPLLRLMLAGCVFVCHIPNRLFRAGCCHQMLQTHCFLLHFSTIMTYFCSMICNTTVQSADYAIIYTSYGMSEIFNASIAFYECKSCCSSCSLRAQSLNRQSKEFLPSWIGSFSKVFLYSTVYVYFNVATVLHISNQMHTTG